jgi:hypothetical protein
VGVIEGDEFASRVRQASREIRCLRDRFVFQ